MWTVLRALAARTGAVFHRGRLDRDFDDELAAHLALLADENVRRGMTPEAARRAARWRVGGLESVRQQHRAARGLPFLDTLAQDLRYTARTLRRDASFAGFAVLTVGLGIGACATIFSVANALLLRPLPFADPGRLTWIANAETAAMGGASVWTMQVGHFLDLRAQSRSFAGLAGYYAFYGDGDSTLTGSGEPERLTGVPVTTDFFSLLGVRPRLGRQFTAEEGHARWNAPQVALLGFHLWQNRFAADPAIVGQRLVLNGAPVTVVGVLPESFDFAAVFAPGRQVDLFFPMPLTAQTDRHGNTLAVVGRLQPGVTVARAQAELDVLAPRIAGAHRERNDLAPRVGSLDRHVSGPFRLALLVLVGAVGAVMLIVCANLANLLLARAAARQREMAVRAALGAGRARLVRQMLTESLVLSAGGGALGLLLAVAGTRAMAHLQAFSIPLLGSVHVDAVALGFTLVLATGAGLFFGLVPALQALAAPPQDALRDSSRGASQSRRSTWLRHGLVVAEVAFASVLLVGAGLLVRSFLRVLDVQLGYQPARAAALRIDLGSRRATRAERNAFYDEALRRVRALPGVDGAALTDVLPLNGDRSWGVAAQGQAYPSGHTPSAFVRIVSDGYLQAMGIPLRAGRDLSPRDTPASGLVVLVNETLARTLWPGQDAVGKWLLQEGGRQVVGVVGDVRHSALEASAGPEMYLPIRQTDDYSRVELVVRSPAAGAGGGAGAGALAAAVRNELRPLEPNLPGHELRPLQQLVDQAVSPRRFVVLLLGGFSVFALLLASLGIYAVISYTVTQRTRELGIRAALGASGRDLEARVLRETLGLAGVGMLIGVLVSGGLAQVLRGLLFGITASDPLTFGGTLAILVLVAALAGYLPARRASRIDPILALRG
jgi:predicted permease